MLDVLVFSILLSLFCMGLRVVSSKGAILHPIRHWMLSRFPVRRLALKESLKEQKFARSQAVRAQASIRELSVIDGRVHRIERKLFWLDAWNKPLFTCSMCMSTVWGPINWFVLWAFIGTPAYVMLGIPIASFLSFVLFNYAKRLNPQL